VFAARVESPLIPLLTVRVVRAAHQAVPDASGKWLQSPGPARRRIDLSQSP
jgi:hypothetical protein